jgi:hypothetical protein
MIKHETLPYISGCGCRAWAGTGMIGASAQSDWFQKADITASGLIPTSRGGGVATVASLMDYLHPPLEKGI